jgi:hypothetical protein
MCRPRELVDHGDGIVLQRIPAFALGVDEQLVGAE